MFSEENSTEDEAFKQDHTSKNAKWRSFPIVTSKLSAALDRVNVRNCKATFILAEAARSLGHDIRIVAVNPESIKTVQLKLCLKSAQATKARFNPSVSLVVHLNGKMLPDIIGNGQADQLPVLISGFQVEQLFGVQSCQMKQASRSAILLLIWCKSAV